MSWKTSTPQRSAPAGIRVGGPTSRTCAPSMLQHARRWSGRRGCAARRRRSPPSGPRSGRTRGACDRASSSAWVGCSCWPSPALITLQLTFCDSSDGRAGRAVAHHQDVRLHGVQRHRRVDQGLALGDRRGARAHVDHVGAQPLAGQLEASSGCGWRPRRTGSSACGPSAGRASWPSGGSARRSRRRGRAGRAPARGRDRATERKWRAGKGKVRWRTSSGPGASMVIKAPF